jgi:hypothetical protein
MIHYNNTIITDRSLTPPRAGPPAGRSLASSRVGARDRGPELFRGRPSGRGPGAGIPREHEGLDWFPDADLKCDPSRCVGTEVRHPRVEEDIGFPEGTILDSHGSSRRAGVLLLRPPAG